VTTTQSKVLRDVPLRFKGIAVKRRPPGYVLVVGEGRTERETLLQKHPQTLTCNEFDVLRKKRVTDFSIQPDCHTVFGCPPNSKFDEWHGFSLPTDEY